MFAIFWYTFHLKNTCQSDQKSSKQLFKNWFCVNGYAHKYTSEVHVLLWKGRILLGMNHFLEEAQSSLLSCAREAPHPATDFISSTSVFAIFVEHC